MERLRRLGYPVSATRGVTGGYRLGAGASLPPLLLDEEEAVAVAVGLRTAASGGVAGIEETAVRALGKLEQMLPERLRRRVNAVGAATVPYPGTGPAVDPATLATVATACRDNERLRFAYRAHDGTSRPSSWSASASWPAASPVRRAEGAARSGGRARCSAVPPERSVRRARARGWAGNHNSWSRNPAHMQQRAPPDATTRRPGATPAHAAERSPP